MKKLLGLVILFCLLMSTFSFADDIDPVGKPEDGRSVRFNVWKDAKGRWHVIWSTAGKKHTFDVSIMVLEGKFTNHKFHSFDQNDKKRINGANNIITCDAVASGGKDGVSFTTDAKKIKFTLRIDGKTKIMERIFIGKDSANPKINPFTLSN